MIGLLNPASMPTAATAANQLGGGSPARGGLFGRMDPQDWFALASTFLTPDNRRGQAMAQLANHMGRRSDQRAQALERRNERLMQAGQAAQVRQRENALRQQVSQMLPPNHPIQTALPHMSADDITGLLTQPTERYNVRDGGDTVNYSSHPISGTTEIGRGSTHAPPSQTQVINEAMVARAGEPLSADEKRQYGIPEHEMGWAWGRNGEPTRVYTPDNEGQTNALMSSTLQLRQQSDSTMRNLETAIDIVQNNEIGAVGFGAGFLAEVGGTPAADVGALLENVLGNEAMAALQRMREAASAMGQRGSGLGQVTEREIRILERLRTALSQGMSRELFLREANQLMADLRETRALREQMIRNDFPELYSQVYGYSIQTGDMMRDNPAAFQPLPE